MTAKALKIVEGDRGTVALRDRDDDELMLLCKTGHTAAFEIIVGRYEANVFGYAAKYLGDRSLAEDACQDVFITLWKHRERYQCQGKLAGYLCRLTLNACRALSRSRSRRGAATGRYSAQRDALDESGPEVEEQILREEREKVLERQISRLPDKLKSTVLLRYYHDLSYTEISERQGISEVTLRSRVYHALRQLRSNLRGRDL